MKVYKLYADMLRENHIIIAGQSGSGKSVILNGFVKTLLQLKSGHLVCIDPKKVELIDYKRNAIIYADSEKTIIQAINKVCRMMDNRYKLMKLFKHKKTALPHVYVVIDEFADLMTMYRKQTLPKICRIAQLGRACGIHLIIATQRPTSDIITGQIKCNIDARIALKCPAKQDSKNIIGVACAEELPKYGYCYFKTVDGLRLEKVPML